MKISCNSRHWVKYQLKFLSLILISAVHSTASAQFNFTLDLMLAKNQTASTEKCPECAGVIRTHTVAPSDQPLSLSPPVRPEPLDSKLAPLARAMTSRSSVGLLVLQGNQVLYEGYTDGVSGQTGLVSFSRAKSVISLAVGKALCDGKISSLDVQAQSLAPELSETVYGRAKISSLLMMASGAATGLPHGETVPGETVRWLQGVKSQLQTLKEYKSEALSPFSKTAEGSFKYKNQDTSALTLVLQSVYAGKTSDWFDELVWKPVRAESPVQWALDKDGVPIGPSFFVASTRDWGRLGLYINQTLRGENQESCLRDYLRQATSRLISTGNQQFQGYGYQMWTNNYRNRTGEIVWFRGVGGQLVALHPRSNSVLVYTSLNDSITDQVASAFVNLVN
jgi:CubicO group peptidase (beta-lactamase class C family)